MHDLDKRIKNLSRAVMWCNIYLVALCAALIGFSIKVWYVLMLHGDAILEIADILKKKGLL